jgi:membrane-associated phospholipid phosphatase
VARNIKAPLAGALACIVGLIVLALLAYRVDAVQRLDEAIQVRLVTFSSFHGDGLVSRLVQLGDPRVLAVMLAIVGGIGLARGRPRPAVAAFAVIAGANLTTQAMKVLFSHPHFQSLLGAEHLAWDGFPSGHTTAAASIGIAFAFVVPSRLRPIVTMLGAGLVAGVGFSVVALDWHFPSDVLGGILVAAAWGFGALAALRATESATLRRSAQPARRAAISVK